MDDRAFVYAVGHSGSNGGVSKRLGIMPRDMGCCDSSFLRGDPVTTAVVLHPKTSPNSKPKPPSRMKLLRIITDIIKPHPSRIKIQP